MYDPFNNSAKESLTSLCGAKTFTVEQAPAVISTRAENSTSLSPSRGASLNRADRRSKDSMTSRRSQNRNLSSGSRNSSLERRRKSVMSDNYRPSQRNSSSGRFYNEERGDSRFKRSASQQSSSSSSSSSSDADAHPKKPPPESKKKLRRSSSSSSSSSVQSIKQPKSELNLRSPSMNSRGSARRSSNLEKSGSHDKRDISQKRKDRFKTGSVSKSRSRSRSRNRSRGHSRNRSRGHSRSRSRGRSRSRSRSRSKSGSKVKYHSHSTRSQSVETKAAKVLGAPEVRDRYGLVQRGTKHLDIFGNLDEEPAKSPKKPVSNTSFLPYCLSTDPAAIKKSLVKPFAVKVKKPGEGESKTLSSFMIKAQHGKRKAVIDLTSTEKKLDPTNDSLPPGSPSKQLAKLEPTPSRESLQSSSRSRSRSKSTYSSRSRSRSHSRSRSRSKSKSRSHHRHRRRHRSRKHDSSRDHKSRRHGRRRRHSRESHRRHRTGRRRSKRSRSRDRKQRYRSRSASKNSDGGRLVCRSVLKQDLTPAKGKPINVQPQTAQPAQANLLGRQPIPATVTESGPAKIAQASLKSLVNQAQMANQNLGQQKNQLQPTKKFVIGKKVKGKKLGAKTGNKLLANQIKQGQGKTEKDQVNKAKVEKIAQEKKLQQMEHFLKSLKEKKGGKQ